MPQAARNPVLLVHGIDDTCAIFNPMTAYLSARGWVVHSLDLIPCNGDVGLDRLAEQIAHYVDTVFPPHQSIDLVGFSMGGIVSRYYVQRLGGLSRVQRFVTIASPHNGTWTGYLRYNIGAAQMRPESAFLQDLNRDAFLLDRINFTSIWTPLDLMIVPASSSQMPVGECKRVWVPGHSQMITDASSLQALATALMQPVKAARQKIA